MSAKATAHAKMLFANLNPLVQKPARQHSRNIYWSSDLLLVKRMPLQLVKSWIFLYCNLFPCLLFCFLIFLIFFETLNQERKSDFFGQIYKNSFLIFSFIFSYVFFFVFLRSLLFHISFFLLLILSLSLTWSFFLFNGLFLLNDLSLAIVDRFGLLAIFCILLNLISA